MIKASRPELKVHARWMKMTKMNTKPVPSESSVLRNKSEHDYVAGGKSIVIPNLGIRIRERKSKPKNHILLARKVIITI
jgi:hypothetical protein